MTEHEILKMLEERLSKSHCFVKWWRKENDFLDYELLETFVENAGANKELGGFELMTIDEMWHELQRLAGSRVKLVQSTDGGTVEWVHEGKSGLTIRSCPYTPENLMNIFDVESKGNPVA